MDLARDRNRFNSRSDEEDDYTQLEDDDYTQLEDEDNHFEDDDYTQLEDEDNHFEDEDEEPYRGGLPIGNRRGLFYDREPYRGGLPIGNRRGLFYDDDDDDDDFEDDREHYRPRPAAVQEDPIRDGLDYVRDDPLVTERGEVMLHDHVYKYQFSYYTNISRTDPFVKLEGLPPILVAYREFHSLVMLTQQYKILIVNESNPDGTILDTPPIKEMICNKNRFFVLDENHNLHELFHDNGSFYLSESYKSDVRLFTFDFGEDLVAIDLSNKMHIFRNGYLRDIPITLEPEHHIRSILHTTSEVVMVDELNNIWEWNGYRKLEYRGTIDHEYRYIFYSYYRIYTIDYEGVLRVKQTRLEASEEIIPGTYIEFFQINQERKVIEDESGRYHVLMGSKMVPLTLPFRLLSIQEYKERMRSRSMIKSARSIVKSARMTGK